MASTAVEIALNLQSAVVDEVQSPSANVNVTVTDRSGAPVGGALVLGRDPEAKFGNWARSDARGHASVLIGVNGARRAVEVGYDWAVQPDVGAQ